MTVTRSFTWDEEADEMCYLLMQLAGKSRSALLAELVHNEFDAAFCGASVGEVTVEVERRPVVSAKEQQ